MCKIFSTFFLSYKNLHVLKIILFISFSLIYNFRIFYVAFQIIGKYLLFINCLYSIT